MSSTSPTNVGIDVSKETLDIAVHETETHWTSKHGFTEFPQLVKSLKALPPTRIIIEASGGIENLLVSYLAAAGLPVIVVSGDAAVDVAHDVRAHGAFDFLGKPFRVPQLQRIVAAAMDQRRG